MDKFEYIVNVLSTSNNFLASECLNKINTEEIIFQPGFVGEKAEIESLYEFRLEIAQDLNKDKFKVEELQNWAEAVKELKTINCRQILLSTIHSEEKLYMIFVNADINVLGTIFFLYQKKSLSDQEKDSEETIARGYTSSSLKYKQGKLIDK